LLERRVEETRVCDLLTMKQLFDSEYLKARELPVNRRYYGRFKIQEARGSNDHSFFARKLNGFCLKISLNVSEGPWRHVTRTADCQSDARDLFQKLTSRIHSCY
jgi:hypothetical protein